MRNFTFLPPAFKDLAESARKAEGQIMGDPRTVRSLRLPSAPRLPRGTVMMIPVLP